MIRIFNGSILDAPVNVIVNPANSFLMNGAGLAKIIEDCAQGDHKTIKGDRPHPASKEYREWGQAILDYRKWKSHKKLIPYGGAVLSPPGALCQRFKGIIHAVGPIWGGGGYHEWELLNSAYRRSLVIARRRGYNIALPAISAGIFGVPIHVVAEAALDAIPVGGLDIDIYFALMDDEHIEAFQRASLNPLEVVS